MSFENYYGLITVGIVCVVIVLATNAYFAKKVAADNSAKYFRQLFHSIFFIIACVALVAASPIGQTLKGQILSLIGIIVSGAIALSSTTLLGNALAGIIMRITRNFKSGDFIQVNEYFGKVSARNLLNIEIQTFDRGLISLPNQYMVSNPMKVLPESGVFVAVEVSLGYDVQRSKVERALLNAAKQNEIENAYVEVKSLLDHSIVYVLHALVTDLERYVSTKSKLHACTVDELHKAKVEIVSPRFVNSRPIDNTPIIAKDDHIVVDMDDNIDDLLFEKANQADRLELLKERRAKIDSIIKAEPADSERAKKMTLRLTELDAKIAELELELKQ